MASHSWTGPPGAEKTTNEGGDTVKKPDDDREDDGTRGNAKEYYEANPKEILRPYTNCVSKLGDP